MSNSTTNLDLISASQASKEVTANSLFDAASPAMLYGRRALTSAGLTWGYYGGTVLAGGVPTQISNGTVALTPSATNYVEADTSTGAVSVNTTGFTPGNLPLYQAITGTGTVTSYADLRVLGGGASSGGTVTSVALTTPGVVYDVTGSPVTGAGTLQLTLIAQAVNTVLAGPASGASAAPSFRALAIGDLSFADTDTALAANSDTRLATQKAVKAYVDNTVTGGAAGVMVFKGVIDCSANPNYPAASAGAVYKVSVAGKLGGTSGVVVEVGDTAYCTATAASGNQATVGSSWNIVQENIDGAVTGPASAADANIAFFNGTTGKIVKDSGVSVSTDGTFAGNSDSLLPSQKAVKTYVTSAVAGVAGSPGGSTTQVQFNDAGAFGGSAALTWNKTSNILIVGSVATPGTVTSGTNSSNTQGATLTIKGGDSVSGTSSTAQGGNTLITSGLPGHSSAAAGAITVKPADGVAASGAAVLIQGATCTGTTDGGTVTISGGTSGPNGVATGGVVTIQGGASSSGVAGSSSGGVTIKTQAAQAGGTTGAVTILTADAPTANFGNGPSAAAVTVTAGKGGDPTSGFNGATGGAVTLTAGVGGNGSGAGAPGAGGVATLNGGAAGTSGTGNASGGNVVLTPGAGAGTGARGNVVLNGTGAALATSATGGFTCMPTCAGAPTGTPANIPTGTVPMVFDSTNFKLYAYVSGAWKSTAAFT